MLWLEFTLLGQFLLAPDGGPGSGSRFASRLMEQSEPGGRCISVVAGDRITSRIGATEDGQENERAGPSSVFAALQWGGLLAYFLCWL